MINKIMNLTESNPMYKNLTDELKTVTNDDLIIVARNVMNRKDDRVEPIAIKNDIYFYVAYKLNDKIAYIGNVTPEQIYIAKANMVRMAKIGSMFSEWKTLDEFETNDDPMLIATLDSKMYGGGLLYCEEFLRAMEKKIGKFFILPSSIHELIFVPVDIMPKSDLCNMVTEINNEMVDENEILADCAFELNEWT